jgi:hypothetical protein
MLDRLYRTLCEFRAKIQGAVKLLLSKLIAFKNDRVMQRARQDVALLPWAAAQEPRKSSTIQLPQTSSKNKRPFAYRRRPLLSGDHI